MVKLTGASGLSAKGSQYIILICIGTRGAKGAVAPKGFTKLRCHTLKAHITQTHNIITGSQHMHRDYYSNERDRRWLSLDCYIIFGIRKIFANQKESVHLRQRRKEKYK